MLSSHSCTHNSNPTVLSVSSSFIMGSHLLVLCLVPCSTCVSMLAVLLPVISGEPCLPSLDSICLAFCLSCLYCPSGKFTESRIGLRVL